MVNKVEVYSSFPSAVAGIKQEEKDGWEVDWTVPPQDIAFLFEVNFTRANAPEPKMSRAEILAKARAAKAANKEGNE